MCVCVSRYSMREGTHAHRRLRDDVDDDVKQRRLREVGQMQPLARLCL